MIETESMKKLLFILIFIIYCLPVTAQPATQQTVKLVPAGDGSYRIVNTADEDLAAARERERAERAEAARWAGVLREEPADVPAPSMLEDVVVATAPEAAPVQKPVQKRKDLAYFSIGAAGINTTVRLTNNSATFWNMGKNFKDTHFGMKGAFGAWMSEHARAEVFFQKRGDVSISGSQNNFTYSAKLKTWDIGANAFLYPNPQEEIRFFFGAGIAATLVQPTFTLNGQNINDVKLNVGGKIYRFELFESKFCLTPSGFAGVEFPLGENTDMDIMAFYSYTNVKQDGIRGIKSFGLAANVHFNLKRKTTNME